MIISSSYSVTPFGNSRQVLSLLTITIKFLQDVVDLKKDGMHLSKHAFLNRALKTKVKSKLCYAILKMDFKIVQTYANIQLTTPNIYLENHRTCKKRTVSPQFFPAYEKSDMGESEISEFDCMRNGKVPLQSRATS